MGRIAAEYDVEAIELEGVFQGQDARDSLLAELLAISEPLALGRLGGEVTFDFLLEAVRIPGQVGQISPRQVISSLTIRPQHIARRDAESSS
jgi:hypothetical protein